MKYEIEVGCHAVIYKVRKYTVRAADPEEAKEKACRRYEADMYKNHICIHRDEEKSVEILSVAEE